MTRTLASFAIPRPPAWPQMSAGERMDWLQELIDAATREYRRYDDATFAETRTELDRLGRDYSVAGGVSGFPRPSHEIGATPAPRTKEKRA